MTAQRIFSGLVVLVGLASPGCTVETTDAELANDEIAVSLDPMGGPGDPQDRPPGSGNGLLPNCGSSAESISAIKLYAGSALWTGVNVDVHGFTNGTLAYNSDMTAIGEPCRKKILKYLVRCALPEDTYVVEPGGTELYWGWLNMTPSWRAGAISPDEQWWLTACFYQHLNGFNVEVPILLDGDNPVLWHPNVSHPEFVKRDSRIWGNLFTAVGDFVPNVCYETDLLGHCGEDMAELVLDTRLCDSDPDLCNINIVGACEDVCPKNKSGMPVCGPSGTKNIGSRMKEFGSYGSVCPQ